MSVVRFNECPYQAGVLKGGFDGINNRKSVCSRSRASLRKSTRLQVLVSLAGSETRAEIDIVAG